MRKFYFDLRNGSPSGDDAGLETTDLAEAMEHALFEAREMICVGAYEGTIDLRHRIEVRDERDRVVGVVEFEDAIDVDRARQGLTIRPAAPARDGEA